MAPPKKPASRSAKVAARRIYIRKDERPLDVHIPRHEDVGTILCIDIGTRNLALIAVRLEPLQLLAYRWIDFFRDPDSTYSANDKLSGVVSQYVRTNPSLFSADLWVIERQPQNEAPGNVVVQNALEAAAAFLGKRVFLMNPQTMKTVLLAPKFAVTGHDANKAQSMLVVRPLLSPEERLAIKLALTRQLAYVRRFPGRRYKCERNHQERWTWDDMADVAVFLRLMLQRYLGLDAFAQPLQFALPPAPDFARDDVWLQEDGSIAVRWPDGSEEEVDDVLGSYMQHAEAPDVGRTARSAPSGPARRVKAARLNPDGIDPKKPRVARRKKAAVPAPDPVDNDDCFVWDPTK